MREAGIIEQLFPELDLQRIDRGRARYGGDGFVGAVRCRRRSDRLRERKLQATQHKGADRNCLPPTYAVNNSGLTMSGQLPQRRYAQHRAQYMVPREIFGPFSRILDRGGTISPEPTPPPDPGRRHNDDHTGRQSAGENRAARRLTKAGSGDD